MITVDIDDIISPETFPEVAQTAFVFAARYVHNRNTGGTLQLCNALRYFWSQLSEETREQILKESQEATTNLDDWEAFRKEVTQN